MIRYPGGKRRVRRAHFFIESFPASRALAIPAHQSPDRPHRSDRLERQKQLEEVARKGYISEYRGVRISRSGRRFWVEDAVVWQLLDESGVCHGQAAKFDSWRPV